MFCVNSPPGADGRLPAGASVAENILGSALSAGFPSCVLITGRMNIIDVGCADPSGTHPVPPLVSWLAEQCTHFTTPASSSLSLLNFILSSSACLDM